MSSSRNSLASSVNGASRRLSLDHTYPCPVCRHGQIEALVLMDAFACNFCRHMLSANLAKQSVQVIDSTQPMTWYWLGRHWRSAVQPDFSLSFMVWLVAVALVVFPAGLVWLSAQIFPPLVDSPGQSLPQIWAGLTLVLHGSMVAWLLAEHYQLSLWVAAKVYFRRYWQSRSST
ncbi:MAG: hypothetical protein AAF215_33320 [Cyanobacteria bacterium P01_A01_bin.123]